MANRIEPPWVELGFYKQGTKSIDLFCAIVKVLAEEQVQFRQWHIIYPDRRDNDEASFADAQSGIDWIYSHSGDFFALATMTSWLVSDRKGTEEVSCFDYADTPVNNKVVRLITTGEDYTTGGEPKRGQKRGIRISRKFKWLCSRLTPTYAAITIPHSMETPEQLLQDAGSRTFSDFYVGYSQIPPRFVEAIRSLLPEAYVEDIGTGLYFSSIRAFNEAGVNVKGADSSSAKVAAILAKALTA